MPAESWIILLIVGALAGWIASKIVNGGGLGLIGDIVVGILGAYIGNWVLPRLGFHVTGSGFIGLIVTAVIGAILLLAIVRVIRRL